MSLRDFVARRPRLQQLVGRVEVAAVFVWIAGVLVVQELYARAQHRRNRRDVTNVTNVHTDPDRVAQLVREEMRKLSGLN